MPRWRKAFTLVELLVVIGIIALLISILVPALAAARRQAMTLKCASNLRTLGQVMHQYADDNKGFIPRDHTRGQPGHIFWGEAFAKYANRSFVPPPGQPSAARDRMLAVLFAKIAIYQCPVFPNEAQTVDYVCNGWDKYTPSGRTQPAFRITKFPRSADIIFMTEANRNRPVGDFQFHDVWHPSHLPRGPAGERRVADDDRHRGNINCVFLDGHVAARPYKSISETDFRLLR